MKIFAAQTSFPNTYCRIYTMENITSLTQKRFFNWMPNSTFSIWFFSFISKIGWAFNRISLSSSQRQSCSPLRGSLCIVKCRSRLFEWGHLIRCDLSKEKLSMANKVASWNMLPWYKYCAWKTVSLIQDKSQLNQ